MSLSKMQVAEREGLIFQDQRPENPTFLSDQLKLSHTRFHGHLCRSCNHRLKDMLRDSFHAVQRFPLCLALADRRLCDLDIKDQIEQSVPAFMRQSSWRSRTEERRVGKEGVSTFRSRWST